jgi:hypothetical protein
MLGMTTQWALDVWRVPPVINDGGGNDKVMEWHN